MKIYGFQKMTLLDYPGKVACTIFTGGCNFRCPFCHNALLVTELNNSSVYREDEILEFLSKRIGLLDGVCVTGGEPLLQPDIAEFIHKIKDMGYLVKLDTNGSFPDKLKELVGDGLIDYVAMDIKNSKEKYGMTVGVPGYDTASVEKSVSFLLEGSVGYEFRTTVVNEFHDVRDFEDIGRWIKGAEQYFLQGFADSGNLIGSDLHAVPKEIMERMKESAAIYVRNTQLRGV